MESIRGRPDLSVTPERQLARSHCVSRLASMVLPTAGRTPRQSTSLHLNGSARNVVANALERRRSKASRCKMVELGAPCWTQGRVSRCNIRALRTVLPEEAERLNGQELLAFSGP